MRSVMAMVLVLVSGVAAAADAGQQKLAEEFFRASGYEAMYSDQGKVEGMMTAQLQAMEDQMLPQMTAQQQQDYREAMAAVRPELTRILRRELAIMKPQMIEAVAATYSESELRALVTFYTSDAGRAIVAKNPELMDRLMAVAGARTGVMMQELQQVVVNKLGAPRKSAQPAAKGK